MSDDESVEPDVAAVATVEQHANFKALMKETEEMVVKARLDQIAREHKSIGAILDDRVLYKIEEPKKRKKRQSFKTALQLQRDAEQRDAAAAEEALVVELAKKEAAENFIPIADYTTELKIWKEKSGQSAYSQSRRFQHPDLQKFKDEMSPEMQKQFKKRCTRALIALSDKFREECRAMKSDMDLNGVFHPEANAHRTHCMYLMKLYKGVSAETIEDPILRSMRSEEAVRAAEQKVLEARKQELLRSMEAAELANMTPAQKEAALAVAEANAEMQKRSEAEEGLLAAAAATRTAEGGGLDNNEGNEQNNNNNSTEDGAQSTEGKTRRLTAHIVVHAYSLFRVCPL
jgi:hypothetical protein